MSYDTEEEKKVFAKTLKVALATSIIRSKPKEVTAKQYAIQLASKLKASETSWKTKDHRTFFERFKRNRHDILRGGSERQTSAEEIKKYNKLYGDYEEAKREIVLLKLQSSQQQQQQQQHSFYNDASSSSQTTTNKVKGTDDESGMEGQTIEKKLEINLHQKTVDITRNEFLASVLSFANWHARLQGDVTAFKTVKESLVRLLKDLKRIFDSAVLTDHDIKLVEFNSKQLKELLTREEFSKDIEIKEITNGIARIMVMKLMNSSASQSDKVKVCLFDCMLVLGQAHPSVRDVILDLLVRVLVGFTSLLKGLPSFNSLNLSKYENVCYIGNALKVLVTSTCSTWPCQKLGEYSVSLDEGLFDICGRFTVYTHTIWTLSSLMIDTIKLSSASTTQ